MLTIKPIAQSEDMYTEFSTSIQIFLLFDYSLYQFLLQNVILKGINKHIHSCLTSLRVPLALEPWVGWKTIVFCYNCWGFETDFYSTLQQKTKQSQVKQDIKWYLSNSSVGILFIMLLIHFALKKNPIPYKILSTTFNSSGKLP